VARFIEIFQPRYVLVENVQGIRHDKTGSLRRMKKALASLGYWIDDRLLSSERVGAPQKRRRYFLMASQLPGAPLEEMPLLDSEQSPSLGWAIADLQGLDSEKLYDSSAQHSFENQRRIDYLFENELHDLPDTERPSCHRNGAHRYQAVYGRLHWDRPAPTITTGFGSMGQGRFVHPKERRTLTPHEAARVQFFPDFFEFGELGRRQYQSLIGNAVPSKLAYAIAIHQLR